MSVHTLVVGLIGCAPTAMEARATAPVQVASPPPLPYLPVERLPVVEEVEEGCGSVRAIFFFFFFLFPPALLLK